MDYLERPELEGDLELRALAVVSYRKSVSFSHKSRTPWWWLR